MKKLTLLVSVYNSGDWLASKFKNLRQCSILRHLEIMVLNAASPDERDDKIIRQNLDIIANYTRTANRIGVYDAWNQMIQASKAPYIANANTDDIVDPACYERQVKVLDQYGPRYGFSYVSWYVTRTGGQIWPPTDADPSGLPGTFRGDLTKAGVGHFPLWRRKLHQQFGYFDTTLPALGDADWWTRCYHGGTKFVWLNSPLACYYWRAEDPDVSKRNLWHQAVNPDEWTKYWSKVERYKTGKVT